jgi:hypothetical protein
LIHERRARLLKISGSWTPPLGSTGKFEAAGNPRASAVKIPSYASIRLRAQVSPERVQTKRAELYQKTES